MDEISLEHAFEQNRVLAAVSGNPDAANRVGDDQLACTDPVQEGDVIEGPRARREVEDRIVAAAPVDDEGIAAKPADESVVAFLALQHVMPAARIEQIVTRAAHQRIGYVAAEQQIGTRAAV